MYINHFVAACLDSWLIRASQAWGDVARPYSPTGPANPPATNDAGGQRSAHEQRGMPETCATVEIISASALYH